MHNARPDWKAALESVKGIYLITDETTGKHRRFRLWRSRDLVPVAQLRRKWTRWECRVAVALATDPSLYCPQVVPVCTSRTPAEGHSDDAIINRESFWKDILLTRGDHGLNRN